MCRTVNRLPNVVVNIKKFFFTCFVVVNQFPIAFTDGARGTDSGSLVSPEVWVMPVKSTIMIIGFYPFQHRDKAYSIHWLLGISAFNLCYIKDGRKKIFNNKVIITSASRHGCSGPFNNHGYAHASLVSRALTTVQWGVLRVQRSIAPPG